jgi:putative ABC transport system permease protein
MRILSLLAKEIAHRKLNFTLSALSVAIGVACVVGTVLILRVFDRETEKTLASMSDSSRMAWDKFQDEMRKDMLEMGFNLMILNKDYELSSPSGDEKYLPESYVNLMARLPMALINHVMPFLQQKVWWPEQKRWITLAGTTGEVFISDPTSQKPIIPRVKKGSAILGYAIHQGLGLKPGDSLTLSNRTFVIQECLPAKGFEDDEQVWIPLTDVQEMLNKKGLITGLYAVNCQCAPKDLLGLHRTIEDLLPGSKVIEHNSKLVARAKVRSKSAVEADEALARERAAREQLKEKRLAFAAILVPFIVVVSVAWLAFLMWSNVRQRKEEIGILSAIGLPSRSILFLFLGKAIVTGILGSLIGLGLGIGVAVYRSGSPAGLLASADATKFCVYVAGAIVMSIVASWIPALVASRIDPAVTLREE